MTSRQRALLFVPATTFLLVGLIFAGRYAVTLPASAQAKYVGRATCAQCHRAETEAWLGSDHDRALDLATETSVLGDFNNAKLTYAGVTSTMFRRDDKFYINTEGPDGKLADFAVKYVIGVRPLQQYMVEFPDGRVQVLRESWDVVKKRWFYHYPPGLDGEKLAPSDPLHWTGRLQNWNHTCAECHSTNLRKNYDPATNTYHTTFAEIDVSCETCHGPGSIHTQLAESWLPFWDANHGYGLPNLKAASNKTQLNSCAKCHSRRGAFAPGHQGADEFFNYYALQLIEPDIYHADGQVLDEDYVHGSFLQSKMYQHNIRCTDCHDPHSTKLKHTGNKVCTSCHQHPVAKYDTPAHHHHQLGGEGASCVECHMPARHYMVVDARRDHSLRIPRPDLSVEIGTPNACTRCHIQGEKAEAKPYYEDLLTAAEKGDLAAKKKIDAENRAMNEAFLRWYGKPKGAPQVGQAIAAAWQNKPGAERALIDAFNRGANSDFLRASALRQLQGSNNPAARAVAIQGLADGNAMIRATAVGNLASMQLTAARLVSLVEPLLDDSIRLVRGQAARALATVYESLEPKLQARVKTALDEYLADQAFNADQPETHMNRAFVHANLGDVSSAIQDYRKAVQLDPAYVPAKFNLAVLYNQLHQNDAAEKLLREIIDQKQPPLPDGALGEAHYLLGLLLAEDPQRFSMAVDQLALAVANMPDNSRAQYNYGLACQQIGKMPEAERALLAAYNLDARNYDYGYALALFYLNRRKFAEANAIAEQMAQDFPGSPQAEALHQHIEATSKAANQKRPPDKAIK